MFHHFTELVANASGWAYAILFVLAFLDALIPIVPSETSVITAGVVASSGDLSLPLVILFAAAGAFAGDNTSYFVGARYGTRINDRFFQSEKAQRRIAWANRQVEERGGELIVIARFIPGGRTVVTLSAAPSATRGGASSSSTRSRPRSGRSTPHCSATSAATPSRSSRGRACCSRSRSRSR